ncbi:hypothetical protein ACS0TY_035087 [Phlomoides rotata]
MSKQIQKSLQECLSKIKISNKHIQYQLPMRGCKKPKTPSFDISSREKEDDAVTLSDIDKFLFENFRSLYQKEYDEETSKKDSKTAAFPFESPRLLDPPPPENLCRSDRFFVSTGSSGSLYEGSSSSTSAANNSPSSSSGESPKEIEVAAADDPSLPEDFIALLTYSPSPYEDFRRSMQEMVDARMEHNGKVDWKFLEELLFCYLDLNNKKSYGYILRAFVDLIVVLREKADKSSASQRRWSGGDRRRARVLKHA